MTFKTCPKCGANLDTGERCDCEDKSSNRTCRYCGRELSRCEANMCYVCEDRYRDAMMADVWAEGSEA